MDSLHNKIRDFWEWFQLNIENKKELELDIKLTADFERNLFLIERLDWEIGPGLKRKWMCAFSPKGDSNLLLVTKEIVRNAPVSKDWEFYAAKPPKKWNMKFTINCNNIVYNIDANTWKHKLYKFKDGTFDLLFKPDEKMGLPDNYLWWAACIIVDSEIGEERRIKYLKNIEVVDDWDDQTNQDGKYLMSGILDNHIPQLNP